MWIYLWTKYLAFPGYAHQFLSDRVGDESLLTGEAAPVRKHLGSQVVGMAGGHDTLGMRFSDFLMLCWDIMRKDEQGTPKWIEREYYDVFANIWRTLLTWVCPAKNRAVRLMRKVFQIFSWHMGILGPNRSQRKECWETSRHCLAKKFFTATKRLKKTTGRLCPIICPVLNFQRATMHSTTLCFSGNQATRCNLGTTWRVKNLTQKPLAFHLGLFDFSPYSPFFTKVTIQHRLAACLAPSHLLALVAPPMGANQSLVGPCCSEQLLETQDLQVPEGWFDVNVGGFESIS